MEGFSNLDLPSAMQTLLVAWLALFLERFLPLNKTVDPFTFFQLVCERMALKVLKTQYSPQQAITSGTLGLLVLLIPTIIIFYLVHSFASYQWLLDILLLYFLLQYNSQVKVFAKANLALAKGQKQLAKDLAQTALLRNTKMLSPLGLNKACLEGMFLRYNHQQVTVLACYLLGGTAFGATLALTYYLCYIANCCWNQKQASFMHFGAFSGFVSRTMQFVPALFTSVTFVFFASPMRFLAMLSSKLYWRCLTDSLLKSPNTGLQSILLLALSFALQVKTGGPVMYEHQKIRRIRFNGFQQKAQEPSTQSIKTLISQTNRHLMVNMLLITWLVWWTQ